MFILLLISQLGLKTGNLILSDLGKHLITETPNFRYLTMVENETIETPTATTSAAKGPTFWNYAGETVGSYAGGFAGGTASFIVVRPLLFLAIFGTDETLNDKILGILMTGTALGSVCGVSLAGVLMKQKGSGIGAFVGAFIFAVGGFLLSSKFGASPIFAIPIGAVIGYNVNITTDWEIRHTIPAE